jgi:hypothetical protein
MRSRTLPLGVLLLFGGACSQILGLSDYEKTDGNGETGGTNSGGAGHTGGKTADGGSNGDAGQGQGGGVHTGGITGTEGGTGGLGDAGAAGTETGGSTTGGAIARGGSTGGVSKGGATSGGKAGTGGTPGSGGTAGKAGTGGATATGGKGGSGGTGGAVGKGGSGGTVATGGAAGKGGTGGAGGTCTTVDMLAGKNPNFDDFASSDPMVGPETTPWTEFTSNDSAIVNDRAHLGNTSIVPQSGENAAWLGGVGTTYAFEDGWFGEYYSLELELTLPAKVTSVVLSCYFQSQTSETAASMAASHDVMVAWLWDYAEKASRFTFHRWTPATTTGGWAPFTEAATGNAAAVLSGKALSLQFYAQVDDLRASRFFIDSCSLNVTSCN